jgi:serine kinase of HPr protein (carbohydrate metabolism regulator)
MIVHAGLIAIRYRTRWRGILIRGPSGSGKSDLAFRTLSHGFRLVADDRVLIFRSGQRVFGRAPAPIQGVVELRGLGIVPLETLRLAEVSLVIDCVESWAIERMPHVDRLLMLGAEIPTLAICPFEASSPAKLCRAIEVLGRARQQDYDPAFPQTAARRST